MTELSQAARAALNGESCLCPDHPEYRPEDQRDHAEHLAKLHDDPTLLDYLEQGQEEA